MDHAEVRALLEEAMKQPGGIIGLVDDGDPRAIEARQHIATCPACAGEWRAWSFTSLALSSATPDGMMPSPGVREAVLAAAAARPRTAPPATVAPPRSAPYLAAPSELPPANMALPSAGGLDPASGTSTGRRREGWVRGSELRRAARVAPAEPAPTAAGSRIRWWVLGAAAAVVLLVAGAVIGRQLAGTGSDSPRADPGRVLAVAAGILHGNGFGLARLTTPEGEPGGVVLVSPGSGRIAVVADVLPPPPDGLRYWCYLIRDGTEYQVGPMHMDGDLAFWAGDATPADLGLAGDTFVVRLEEDGSPPLLSGTFQG